MPSPPQPFTMGRAEFVALLAMMMASVAFSIDAMLPALPMIGQELTPDRPQNAPLILSMFLFGMGVGTFFTGADGTDFLSDHDDFRDGACGRSADGVLYHHVEQLARHLHRLYPLCPDLHRMDGPAAARNPAG